MVIDKFSMMINHTAQEWNCRHVTVKDFKLHSYVNEMDCNFYKATAGTVSGISSFGTKNFGFTYQCSC